MLTDCKGSDLWLADDDSFVALGRLDRGVAERAGGGHAAWEDAQRTDYLLESAIVELGKGGGLVDLAP